MGFMEYFWFEGGISGTCFFIFQYSEMLNERLIPTFFNLKLL